VTPPDDLAAVDIPGQVDQQVTDKVSAQVYSEVYEKIKVVLDRHLNP
jgi:hypothetical protein